MTTSPKQALQEIIHRYKFDYLSTIYVIHKQTNLNLKQLQKLYCPKHLSKDSYAMMKSNEYLKLLTLHWNFLWNIPNSVDPTEIIS